jgi:signal transduction histidine kinase
VKLRISVKEKIILSLWAVTFLVLALTGAVASVWFHLDQSSRLDDFLVRETRGVQDIVSTYFDVNSGESPDQDSVTNPEFLAFLETYFAERVNRPLPFKTTLGIADPSGRLVKVTNTALDLSVSGARPSEQITLVDGTTSVKTRIAVVALTHRNRILGSIHLATLTSTLSETWNSFLMSFSTVLITLFLAFGLVGTLLIHWALRPVRDMSDSAQKISESHLDLRLAEPSGNDEMAQMARTLNKLLERLERDFEFEEALVGQISHELRTPLTILRGRNEVAIERHPGGAVQAILEDNLADIDTIVALLNTLLNLAKLDGRTELVARGRCDLVPVLRDLIEELDPLWEEKDLSFHLSLPGKTTSWEACPPLTAQVDPLMVRQAFLNILTNAFKYTPNGSRIHLTVEAASPQRFWRLVFRNPGPAIPEESLELVFKRFYRVEVQDPDRYEKNSGLGQKGFGLGLSIAKTMVELNSGQIRAFNPPGGGAAFEVLLPMEDKPVNVKKQRSPQ